MDLLERLRFWNQRRCQIASFEGIALADLCNDSSHFRETILASLRLIKEVDPKRYLRIQQFVSWVVNCALDCSGAEYVYKTRTCRIDFEEPNDDWDREFSIGWHARTLIHEATHGYLYSRKIEYSSNYRLRIERICVDEENRFLHCLSVYRPALANKLFRDFDESIWIDYWKVSVFQRIYSLLRRTHSKGKTEQDAAANP